MKMAKPSARDIDAGGDFLPRLEREARAAVDDLIEAAATHHLSEMAAIHKGATL